MVQMRAAGAAVESPQRQPREASLLLGFAIQQPQASTQIFVQQGTRKMAWLRVDALLARLQVPAAAGDDG